MKWVDLAIAGIPTGCIAALSGMGLVLTYRATGVFNFAHGAIAVLVAFVNWQMAVVWGWPLWLSAALTLLVLGPFIGVALERAVFRPLQKSGAATSEKLVAILGVFVLIVGLCAVIWGFQTKTDAPRLLPRGVWRAGRVTMSFETIWLLVIVAVSVLALMAMFRYTHLGTQIRAVVDKRELAELSSVNANRVAAIAWAIGCGFAGLTGVLLAPSGKLDPFHLTLLVIDTFAVAVMAKLASLPLAVASGLGLGIAQSMMTGLSLRDPLAAFPPNLLITALLVALLVYRNLDEVGVEGLSRGLVSSAVGRRDRVTRRRVYLLAAYGLVLVVTPFALNDNGIAHATKVLAFFIVFLSIVVITGFSGHISLGQAGFAGLGAYFTARIAHGQFPGLPAMPVLLAMLIGALFVIPIGMATGYPALRRKGLFLGLTTLAVGLVVYRFIFEQPFFTKGGMFVVRPNLFGLSLDGDKAFYFFTLAWAALMLLLARNLRSGRLGRILAAMRDSDTGASAIGISLRTYKLFVFSASAFIAAIGGTLIAQQARSFDSLSYDPFQSLFWFTAVVVAGISYASGAYLAAILFVVLDAFAGRDGTSTIVIGLLALFVGRLPGGLIGGTRALLSKDWVPAGLGRRLDAAKDRPPPPGTGLEPSDYARELLAANR